MSISCSTALNSTVSFPAFLGWPPCAKSSSLTTTEIGSTSSQQVPTTIPPSGMGFIALFEMPDPTEMLLKESTCATSSSLTPTKMGSTSSQQVARKIPIRIDPSRLCFRAPYEMSDVVNEMLLKKIETCVTFCKANSINISLGREDLKQRFNFKMVSNSKELSGSIKLYECEHFPETEKYFNDFIFNNVLYRIRHDKEIWDLAGHLMNYLDGDAYEFLHFKKRNVKLLHQEEWSTWKIPSSGHYPGYLQYLNFIYPPAIHYIETLIANLQSSHPTKKITIGEVGGYDGEFAEMCLKQYGEHIAEWHISDLNKDGLMAGENKFKSSPFREKVFFHMADFTKDDLTKLTSGQVDIVVAMGALTDQVLASQLEGLLGLRQTCAWTKHFFVATALAKPFFSSVHLEAEGFDILNNSLVREDGDLNAFNAARRKIVPEEKEGKEGKTS